MEGLVAWLDSWSAGEVKGEESREGIKGRTQDRAKGGL